MLTSLLLMTVLNANTVEIPVDTTVETLDQSIERHQIARANCAAGIVEDGDGVVRAYSWAFMPMNWLETNSGSPFEEESSEDSGPFASE